MTRLRILALPIFILAAAAGTVLAAEETAPTPEGKTLEGIKAFGIMVGKLDPELEKAGMTPELLKEDMRSFLLRRGVIVLKAGESAMVPGSPKLFLGIRARREPDGRTLVYGVTLQALQDVLLKRNRQEAYAATWDAAEVGAASDREAIRRSVEALLERFVDEYGAAQSDRRRR